MAVEVKDKLVTVESAKVIHDSLNQKITEHSNNTANPHNVTPSQIGAVPISREINGKALSSNINLVPSDIGASAEGHTHPVDEALSESSSNPVENKAVSAAINQLSTESANIKNTADTALANANNAQTTANSKATVKPISVTLSKDNWVGLSQVVEVNGVSTTNTIVVTPAPENFLEYTNSIIRCTSQETNSLTFNCEETPVNDILVNVIIIE